MRAAVLPAFGGRFEMTELPDPMPAVGEVVVDVVSCGAGLTLEHVRNGVMGGTPPFVMGHEFAGRISRLGEATTGWAVGDRVTATFYLTCGVCDMCADGHDTLCRSFHGWIGAARNGAFAEHIALPARNLVRVPEAVDLALAGVIADAVATPLHVARDRIRIVAGDRVAVLGAGGGLGVHMLAVARAFGAYVIGIERDPRKLQALKAGGHADLVVDASEDGWEDRLKASTGGVAACVDTVGSTETLAKGMRTLGSRGSLVILGLTKGARLEADPFAMLLGETSIVGTRYCNRAEIAASLDLVALGKVKPVIGARFPLDRLEDAFNAIRANEVFGRIVIDVAP